jgi:hypothetical protein
MFRQITKSLAVLALVAMLPTFAVASTLEITGPPGASLVINGRPMGFFPLDDPLDLAGGTYDLKCELPGHITYENSIKLMGDSDWQRVTVRLVPFRKKTAWTSNLLFAGLGQHYLEQSRGWIYNAAEAGGLLVALFAELERNNLKNDYLDLQYKYDTSINADDITRYREAADQAYSDMKDKEDLRNTGLIVAGAAIVVSVVDVILFFPEFEAGTGSLPLETGALEGQPWIDADPLSAAHVALRLEF